MAECWYFALSLDCQVKAKKTRVLNMLHVWCFCFKFYYEYVIDINSYIVLLNGKYFSKYSPCLLILSCSFQSWQRRYMLLLWLSIIIMIPFDMCRLDGASDGSVTASRKAPITNRIIEFGKVACSIAILKTCLCHSF